MGCAWQIFSCTRIAAIIYVFLNLALLPFPERAQSQSLSFEEYDPPSTLVVPINRITRAKFPFVDVHNHQWGMPSQNLQALTTAMDSLNMAVLVNLSGRGFQRVQNPDGTFRFSMKDPDFLIQAIDNASKNAPGRFIIFTNIDFEGIGQRGWIDDTIQQLVADVRAGAQGLKVYKSLGLSALDSDGRRVATDDPRLDPIWHKCAELGIPVLIHTGDPAPFWQPHDKNNERWLELKQRPERRRDPDSYPPWEQIMAEQHNVFRRHPDTIFISAHLSWLGNDLARLGRLLDELPNMYTEIGAVLAELGRQPRFARQWFIKYQDRILFGKDTWRPQEYYVYFRVLETADEYFDYYRRRHAFWKMYGLDLPDDVLRKLYYQNALRILPGLDASMFPE
jgi:predicted TIM-barrel fold metal-dependent hydrolase